MAISKRKTKSSKNIKANVSPSKSIYLPFKEIGETRFEEFTRKLCNLVFPKYERFELKCSKGQKQFGVDAECFNADGDTETLLSAKCYDRTPVTAAKIKTWVDDFFGEFEIHWKEKGVKRFILAITHDGNNDLINDEVRNQKKVLKRHGIEFQAWFNSKLHDICIKDERLVYEFFGATVLPDYYPHYKTVVIDSRAPSAGLFGTDFTTRPPDELDALKKSNNKSVSDLIEIYVSRRRAGNSSELKTYLTEVKTNQTEWQTLTNEVQAKIHRLSASMALDIGNTELAKAETAYAEQLAKLPDQVLPALIAYHETGVDAALEVLNEATEPSEFELKVALLIEGDRLDDAIVVLDQLEESAETCRLRGFHALKNRDFEIAITCSEKAYELNSASFGNSLALIFAHLYSALVEGTWVGIGPAISPFNPALVQKTKAAQVHLDRAWVVVEKLVTQCSGEQLNDAEALKLALLLCQKAKQQEALEYAQELALKEEPDPLHVAWALMIGVDLPLGKLRKRLGDAIRLGKGTPSHVVLLAMLAEDIDSSPTPVEIVNKHIEEFPRYREFLEAWLEEFESSERQTRMSVISGDKSCIDKLLAQIEEKADQPQFILLISEVLADVNAWTELNSLRSYLLKFNSPRFYDLAARAAYNTQNFSDVTIILDQAKSLFADDRLPAFLEVLRANALDAAGEQGALLDALYSLDREEPSIDVKRNIILKLMEFNRGDEAARHAREMVEYPNALTTDYLMAAKVNLEADPDFSKQLTEKIIKTEEVDLNLVPNLMDIQHRLGTFQAETQQKFNALTQAFFSSDNVVRLDGVEELISTINELSEQKREERRRWEQGQSLSHKAFSSEFHTFAKLYLSNRVDIKSELGDFHKPIVATAGMPKKQLPQLDGDTKTELALDVSALLIAWRFGFMKELETLFNIRVPRSAVRFLNELLENWPVAISVDDIAKFHKFEKDNLPGLSIAGQTLSKADILQRWYDVDDLPAALDTILNILLQKGKISQDAHRRLINELHLEDWSASEDSTTLPEEVYISGALLLTLLRCDAFDAVSALVKVRLPVDDLLELQKTINDSQQDFQDRSSVEELRDYCSQKLASDGWTTLPLPPRPDMSDNEVQQGPIDNSLLLSFWETYNYASQDKQPLVWIEDRYLGRYNQGHVLALSDILKIMQHSKTVAKARVKSIAKSVQRSGIGFQELEIGTFVNALKQATVNDDGIIEESAELSELKRVFGIQASLLPYTDWNEQRFDEDKRPVGELRNTKDIGFLLPNLLRKLWFEEKFEEGKLVAASNWAWTHLRINAFREPRENETMQEKYTLNLASLILVDCAIQPFFDALQNTQGLVVNYQRYINWLFYEHILSRLLIDPELRENFVRSLSNIFSSQFGKHLFDQADMQKYSEQLLGNKIIQFVELLPETVGDEVMTHNELAKRCKTKRDYLINTATGSFSLPDIHDAAKIALIADELSAPIKNLIDEADAELVIEYDDEGSTKILIRNTDESALLRQESTMLSLPETEQREILFERFLQRKPKRPKFVKAARAILQEDCGPNDRWQHWQELRRSDFSEMLSDLRYQMLGQKAVSRELLRIPPLAVLQEYLCLDDKKVDSIDDAFPIMIDLISGELDFQTAYKRVASIILFGDFAEKFLESYESDIDAEVVTLPQKILQFISSVKENPGEFVEEIYGEVEGYLDLFTVLVRKGSREMLISEEYCRLPSWKKIMLSWVWADALANVLISIRINPRQFAENINASEASSINQLLGGDGKDSEFRLAGLELTKEWCYARIFGVLVLKKTSALVLPNDAKLLSLIGEVKEYEWVPEGQFIFPLASENWPFAKQLSIAEWASTGLINLSTNFKAIGRKEIADKVLADYETSETPLQLLCLFLLSPMGSLDEAILDSLKTKIEHELRVAGADLKDQHKMLLRLYGRVTGELNDTAAFKEFMKELIWQRYGPSPAPKITNLASRDENNILFELLADASFVHSQMRNVSAAEKIDCLGALLSFLYERWPHSCHALKELVSNLINRTPVTMCQPLWRLLTRLRTTK